MTTDEILRALEERFGDRATVSFTGMTAVKDGLRYVYLDRERDVFLTFPEESPNLVHPLIGGTDIVWVPGDLPIDVQSLCREAGVSWLRGPISETRTMTQVLAVDFLAAFQDDAALCLCASKKTPRCHPVCA